MKLSYILSLLLLFLIIIMTNNIMTIEAKDYRSVLSGNLKVGDKFFTDIVADDGDGEILDQYYYKRCWLKYKQKLTTDNYYYLKAQYYRKEYNEKTRYNNISLNLWGNYTYMLSSKLKNRWKINVKDKDYYRQSDKSYRSVRLKYQIDYDYTSDQQYTVYVQRQWENYLQEEANDNISDRLSLNWEYDINERLDLNTTVQFEQQRYNSGSERSNKYGKNISLGFKYEL